MMGTARKGAPLPTLQPRCVEHGHHVENGALYCVPQKNGRGRV